MNPNNNKNNKTTPESGAKKRRWLIAIVALAVIAGLALVLALERPTKATSKTTSSTTFAVRTDDLTITVTESGSIKARNSIDLKSEVEGRATIINIVPEGTYVTQEDVENEKVLCELDSGDLEERLVQREIEFASSEASLAEANEAYHIRVKQNESDISQALLDVRFALMDLQKSLGATLAETLIETANKAHDPNVDLATLININALLDDPNALGGGASQQLGRLQDDILLAEEELKRARNTLMWTEKLREKEYVSETDLESDRLRVQRLEIDLERSKTELNLFRTYDFSKETQRLLSNYLEANRELERKYARARSQLAQEKARLENAKARFNLQKDRLNKTKKQLDACTIKAPAPGLVVYGSSENNFRRYRGEVIAAGETVYQRQTIISLPDIAEMMAEIAVHESSVDKVRPGQKATIIMDAFPDRTFLGEVLKVAPLPDQQRGWLSPDIKVYTTQVGIEGTHDFLKPGMSAKVEILVDHLNDVLIVPVQVVANRGGKKVCYVTTSQGIREREVVTGAFNDTYVQILEGLQQGEQALLNPPRITETRTKDQRQADEPTPGQQGQSPAADTEVEDSSEKRTGQFKAVMQDGEPNEAVRQKMEQFRQMMKDGEPNEEMRKRMEQFRSNMQDEQRQRPGGGGRQGGARPQRQQRPRDQ